MGLVFDAGVSHSSTASGKTRIKAFSSCPVDELPIRFFARQNALPHLIPLIIPTEDPWNQFLGYSTGAPNPLADNSRESRLVIRRASIDAFQRNIATLGGFSQAMRPFSNRTTNLVEHSTIGAEVTYDRPMPSYDMNGNSARTLPTIAAQTLATPASNRFQVRIPPATSEADRREIVRYVNTFAEFTDRTLRTHAPPSTTPFRPLDAEMIRRAVTAQISDTPFVFSDSNLHSFVQTIGAQMVNAFIEHARISAQRASAQHDELLANGTIDNDAMTTRSTSETQLTRRNEAAQRRLTIYIVHERFMNNAAPASEEPSSSIQAPVRRPERTSRETREHHNAAREMNRASFRSGSLRIPSRIVDDATSTAYLELRARLSGLRAIMTNGDRLEANHNHANVIGEFNEEDLMIDLQQTLARLRSGTGAYQRNVRRRTVIIESEDESADLSVD